MRKDARMTGWLAELKRSFLAVATLGVLLCGVYPLAVWVLAQGLYPARANGSFISRDGTVVGSDLIGQGFRSPAYFHPRPSAAGEGYDARRSGGTNLGPLAKGLAETIRQRMAGYRLENGLPEDARVPADAVTASASGLDPHISLENARLQAPRVARSRRLPEGSVLRQIDAATEGRTLGILGEPRVNVLRLNLALDRIGDAGR
jgi:K+-transporting ATPase ATPase C chain